MRGTTNFLSLKPVDHGIWNLGLLIRPLLLLSQNKTPAQISDELQIERKTLNNRFRLARDLTLLQGSASLSELGEKFVQRIDPKTGLDSLSDGQAELLRDFIARFPFDSAAIFGIYSMVDAVWTLSRNTYPIGIDLLSPYFRDTVREKFGLEDRQSFI